MMKPTVGDVVAAVLWLCLLAFAVWFIGWTMNLWWWLGW